MIAYKGFDKNMQCRGFQYKIGETYEIAENPIVCEKGFHFCKDLVLCFEYYENNGNNIFCEVEILGNVDFELPTKHKGATNKIRIVRTVDLADILMGNYNSGDKNSGNKNSGNKNSGNYNSGNYNSGDYNSGNKNSGNKNSGNYNSGNYNSGDKNSGNKNSGNYNSGNYNSGDKNSGNYNLGDYNSGNKNSGNWNKSDNNNGFFNSKDIDIINVFNKPCSKIIWLAAKKPSFLFFCLADGKTYKESFQESFKSATVEEINQLKNLPNFDADVFFEISGIKII